MNGLPDGDVILASAARFLIDGGDDDAASLLLSCELTAYTSGDTWWQGDEQVEAVHIDISGPRAAFEALNDRRENVNDVPFEMADFLSPTPAKPPATPRKPVVASNGKLIYDAIEAVLPSAYYVKHYEVTAALIEIDPEWRTELLEIARGKGVHNQALWAKAPVVWQNLNFRSKSEMKIAQALDRAKIMFLPNCRARLGVDGTERKNREADFLICHKGKWGILEVDGEPFHPPARTAEDHERDRLFKEHGVRVIEHYDATPCYQTPDLVVAQFIRLLSES